MFCFQKSLQFFESLKLLKVPAPDLLFIFLFFLTYFRRGHYHPVLRFSKAFGNISRIVPTEMTQVLRDTRFIEYDTSLWMNMSNVTWANGSRSPSNLPVRCFIRKIYFCPNSTDSLTRNVPLIITVSLFERSRRFILLPHSRIIRKNKIINLFFSINFMTGNFNRFNEKTGLRRKIWH